MPVVTRAELLEIVPELRAMAAAAKTATIRETLDLLANRYAAMAAVGRWDSREELHREIALD